MRGRDRRLEKLEQQPPARLVLLGVLPDRSIPLTQPLCRRPLLWLGGLLCPHNLAGVGRRVGSERLLRGGRRRTGGSSAPTAGPRPRCDAGRIVSVDTVPCSRFSAGSAGAGCTRPDRRSAGRALLSLCRMSHNWAWRYASCDSSRWNESRRVLRNFVFQNDVIPGAVLRRPSRNSQNHCLLCVTRGPARGAAPDPIEDLRSVPIFLSPAH